MFQFLLGFASGVYVGTRYDCSPLLKQIEKIVNDNFPKEK